MLLSRIYKNKKTKTKKQSCPWRDSELRQHMEESNQATFLAISSGRESNWQKYRRLRNFVTKLNRKKKR